jgi:hypothetical protein
MNINIKLLTGQIINIQVADTTTIKEIKEKNQSMEGIEPSQQRIMLRGKLLEDNIELGNIQFDPDSQFNIVLELRSSRIIN